MVYISFRPVPLVSGFVGYWAFAMNGGFIGECLYCSGTLRQYHDSYRLPLFSALDHLKRYGVEPLTINISSQRMASMLGADNAQLNLTAVPVPAWVARMNKDRSVLRGCTLSWLAPGLFPAPIVEAGHAFHDRMLSGSPSGIVVDPFLYMKRDV